MSREDHTASNSDARKRADETQQSTDFVALHITQETQHER